MKSKNLFVLIGLLAIAPQLHPMVESTTAETSEAAASSDDAAAIASAPWMCFDDALMFKDNAEIIISCFIAVLEKWQTSATMWEHESCAAEHKGKVTTFLQSIMQILKQMLQIKKNEKPSDSFICVFDIDGTICYTARNGTCSVTYEFLPTLMLYHAAVAVGCQIHIISARHQPKNTPRNSLGSPHSLTIRQLSNLDLEEGSYILHLNEGDDFTSHPINERAGKMGEWKRGERELLAEQGIVLFTIDDLHECLEGGEHCLGVGIHVPFNALAAHYCANKDSEDLLICRQQKC